MNQSYALGLITNAESEMDRKWVVEKNKKDTKRKRKVPSVKKT